MKKWTLGRIVAVVAVTVVAKYKHFCVIDPYGTLVKILARIQEYLIW